MVRRHRLLVVVLVLLASVLVLATIAVAVLADTRWGRAHVASLVSSTITGQIAGELKIEQIDALSYGRVEAHGVSILAPDGKPAIEAEHAIIYFEPSQLWSNTPGWSRAEIDHCHVRVTEGPNGKTNMEETFADRPKPGSEEKKSEAGSEESKSELDLRTMVTSKCKLVISGGELPTLEMVDLAGIMRVFVTRSGDTELRFDEYSGTFTEGLPTGVLEFRDVHGEVRTAQNRLLHFDGKGHTEGAPVTFSLDIATKPKSVKIDATFPEVSLGSIRTSLVAAWTKFSPTLELDVHREP